MTTYTQKTVNDNGLMEIAKFLTKNTNQEFTLSTDRERLQAWARDAEFQMGEGNTPTIEISAVASIFGRTQEFTISAAGLDSTEVEIDE